jgi:hypothetical protein
MRSVEKILEFLQPARPSQKTLGQERSLRLPVHFLPVEGTLIASFISARLCPTLIR